MSAKLLKISFVILLLVTLGELGYYFYVSQKNKVEVSSTDQNRLVQISQSVQNEKYEGSPLINETLIGYLRSRKQTNNQKFYLTEEAFGHISDLFESQGEQGIVIVDDNNKRVITVTHDDKMKYFRKVGDNQVSMSRKDMKVGDKILFKSYTDLVTNIEISAEVIINY